MRKLLVKLALYLVERYRIVTPAELHWRNQHNERAEQLRATLSAKHVLSVRIIEAELAKAGVEDSLKAKQQELDAMISASGENKKAMEELLKREQAALAHAVNLSRELADSQERLEKLAGDADMLNNRLKVAENTLDNSIPLPPSTKELLSAAVATVKSVEAESRGGASGEYKRHIALDRMMSRFPVTNIRDITLAIELAVRNNL